MPEKTNNQSSISRKDFLKNSLIIAGSVAVGLGVLFSDKSKLKEDQIDAYLDELKEKFDRTSKAERSKLSSKIDKNKKPNIIIFMADDLRGDVVNNHLVKIPHIDSFAKDSISYQQNFVANPVCSPSRISISTGLYPSVNGHRSLYQPLFPWEDNLYKFLKDDGYKVVMVGKNDMMSDEAVNISFDEHLANTQKLNHSIMIDKIKSLPYPQKLTVIQTMIQLFVIEKKGFSQLVGDKRLNDIKVLYEDSMIPFTKDNKFYKSHYFGRANKDDSSARLDYLIVDEALKFLDKNNDEPFCLYLNVSLPHTPYHLEEPYFSMYDRNKIPDLIKTKYDDKPKFMKEIHYRYGLNKLSDSDFKEIKATYFGMVTKLDDLFGMVINKLKEKNLYEKSFVCFTSDNGDYTGDYGLTEKWPTGYQDCLTKVPLMIKFPNNEYSNKKTNELTQSIDLFSTVLDVAGIEVPYTNFSKSLLPLAKEEKNPIRDFVISVGGYNPNEPQCFEDKIPSPDSPMLGQYYDKVQISYDDPKTVARSTMIRTKEWKYILRSSGEDELYDLINDPDETKNLINDTNYTKEKNDMKEKLLKWYLDTSDAPHWSHFRNP